MLKACISTRSTEVSNANKSAESRCVDFHSTTVTALDSFET
jgi:hypothetical protein